ncbi:THUMP domain-containing class I SAM-dependent RNA methyltransferase [Gracilibacillus kekensis]|uniref:Putative N6-adenine-specific DNA methylase n=1 Tax=Gracilibacillus kekensis TaxID=1027249 RepID=A0A1M7PP06_9BACI|nr:class I SAM-dependent RNA methyltransferase [Gracilibacillus kekensis]SHN19059.1 putative N6-adenine-specific DNA methylase [Gracilibacillus kekensis]
MKTVKLIATAAMGLESLVAKEVRQLGYDDVTVENGKVIFNADHHAIARCNLWLRTADRIKLIVGEFEATTYDELFEGTKALDWEQYIPENGKFPVVGKSHKSKLFSVPDCQSIVKKAIVEKLKQRHGIANWLEETGAEYKVEVALLKDKVTLTLDTSGAGLHKRGYRIGQGDAPLKETLAAALVQLTNWRVDEPFHDLFCGSGTIPIEAALIGQNIAPGFNRSFAAEEWEFISSSVWDKALEEAEDLANYDQPLAIYGTDLDPKVIEIAKDNAIEAGLADLVSWKQMQATDFHSQEEGGYIVSNPPYGERLGDKKQVEAVYQKLGKVLKNYPTWSIYILTANENFESLFGQKASKKRKLFNAFIKTDYYQYFGKKQ